MRAMCQLIRYDADIENIFYCHKITCTGFTKTGTVKHILVGEFPSITVFC